MTEARLLPAATRPARLWKNGGGLTREIAAYPPGADMDGFLWRISTATVTGAGPFSVFPGVMRTLAVLEGTLELHIGAEARRHRLDAGSPPLCFPGDAPVLGVPVNGPVTDLNLMVRRGACEARMERLAGGTLLPASGATTLIIATAAMEIDQGGTSWRMEPLDGLLIGRGQPVRLPTSAAGYVIVMG